MRREFEKKNIKNNGKYINKTNIISGWKNPYTHEPKSIVNMKKIVNTK